MGACDIMKYLPLLFNLKDEVIYAPSTIVDGALNTVFLMAETPERKEEKKQRIRLALYRFASLHCFPDEGDGKVQTEGQAPLTGWYGWRWKDAANNRTRRK